jgi:hypothetical protein
MPEHLIEKISSGYTLAPEKDARPAVVLHAGDDFAALAAPTQHNEDDE